MKGGRLYARVLQTDNHVESNSYFLLFSLLSIIIVTELTHSKTILEITVLEPQPAALEFKNLS